MRMTDPREEQANREKEKATDAVTPVPDPKPNEPPTEQPLTLEAQQNTGDEDTQDSGGVPEYFRLDENDNIVPKKAAIDLINTMPDGPDKEAFVNQVVESTGIRREVLDDVATRAVEGAPEPSDQPVFSETLDYLEQSLASLGGQGDGAPSMAQSQVEIAQSVGKGLIDAVGSMVSLAETNLGSIDLRTGERLSPSEAQLYRDSGVESPTIRGTIDRLSNLVEADEDQNPAEQFVTDFTRVAAPTAALGGAGAASTAYKGLNTLGRALYWIGAGGAADFLTAERGEAGIYEMAAEWGLVPEVDALETSSSNMTDRAVRLRTMFEGAAIGGVIDGVLEVGSLLARRANLRAAGADPEVIEELEGEIAEAGAEVGRSVLRAAEEDPEDAVAANVAKRVHEASSVKQGVNPKTGPDEAVVEADTQARAEKQLRLPLRQPRVQDPQKRLPLKGGSGKAPKKAKGKAPKPKATGERQLPLPLDNPNRQRPEQQLRLPLDEQPRLERQVEEAAQEVPQVANTYDFNAPVRDTGYSEDTLDFLKSNMFAAAAKAAKGYDPSANRNFADLAGSFADASIAKKDSFSEFIEMLGDDIVKHQDQMNNELRHAMEAANQLDIDRLKRIVNEAGQGIKNQDTRTFYRMELARNLHYLAERGTADLMRLFKESNYRISTEEARRLLADNLDFNDAVFTELFREQGRIMSQLMMNRGARFDPYNLTTGEKNVKVDDKLEERLEDLVESLLEQAPKEIEDAVGSTPVSKGGDRSLRSATVRDLLDRGVRPEDINDAFDEAFEEALAYRNVRLPKDQRQVAKAAGRAGFARLLKEVFVTNILSNPTTIGINVVSSLINVMLKPLLKTSGAALSFNREGMLTGWDEAIGQFYWFKKSLEMAVQSAKLREGILEQRDITDLARSRLLAHDPNAPLPVGILRRAYTGFMDTQLLSDELSKQMRYRGVRAARATRAGRKAGLKGEALRDHVQDYVQKGFDAKGRALDTAALREAQDVVFQRQFLPESGPLSNAINTVEKFRGRDDAAGVLATVLFPFIRTPLNIMREMAEYTGLRMAFGVTGKDQFTNAVLGRSGIPKDDIWAARGKLALGASFMTTMYMLAESGVIEFTGAEYGYWKSAKQQRQQAPPYSFIINVNGQPTAFSITRLAPFTGPFIPIANYLTEFRKEEQLYTNGVTDLPAKQFDTGRLLESVISTFYAFGSEAPMLQTFQNVMDLWEAGKKFGRGEGDTRDLADIAGYQLRGFTTPGQVKMMSRLNNPRVMDVEAETAWEQFYNRMIMDWAPESFGVPRRDVLGYELPLFASYPFQKAFAGEGPTDAGDWFAYLMGAAENPTEIRSTPAHALYKKALLSPHTNEKSFLLNSPKTVWTTNASALEQTKHEGSVDLSKMTTTDGKNAWAAYQDLYYNGTLGSSETISFKDLGFKFTIRPDDTVASASNRLAQEPEVNAMTPMQVTEVLNKLTSEFRRNAKKSLEDKIPALKDRFELNKEIRERQVDMFQQRLKEQVGG